MLSLDAHVWRKIFTIMCVWDFSRMTYLALAHHSGRSWVPLRGWAEVEAPQWVWRCVSPADHSSGDAGCRSRGLYQLASGQKWTARSPLKWKHPPPHSSCSVRNAAHNPAALRRRRGLPGGRPDRGALQGLGSPSEPPAAGPPGGLLSTEGDGSHRAMPLSCPARPQTQSSPRPSNASLSVLQKHERNKHYLTCSMQHDSLTNVKRCN